MITIILPGASLKNKAWAEELAAAFAPDTESKILQWSWWEVPKEGGIDLTVEGPRLLALLPSGAYSILAKSIGTYLLVNLLPKLSPLPEKIILCGVPLNDISEEEKGSYQALADYPTGKLIVYQNSADPHGSFTQVKEFMTEINPAISVLETPGDTHDYPDAEDFKKFLLG